MLRRFRRPPRYIDHDLCFGDFYGPRSIDRDLCFGDFYGPRSIDRDLCFGDSTRASTTNDIAPAPVLEDESSQCKARQITFKAHFPDGHRHRSQCTGHEPVRCACSTSPPQRSVHRSLVGHPALCTSSTLGLGTQRTQLENHARTACRTPLRPVCARHQRPLPQRSAHRSLVGHPALCTSSTLAIEPANATRHECRANAFEDIATNRLRYPPAASPPTFRAPFPGRSPGALHFVDPGRPACECQAAQTRANTFAEIATNRPRLPQRSAHRSLVGHPALCTSSTLALKPAKDRHCERQHILPGRQSRLSALRTGRVSPAVPSNVPCRSPSAFHLDDPCPKAWKDDALQTARTRLAGLRHACAAHRLRLPHRSVHRSVVGHPALCTSSTPALVRRIQKVASSMHTRADQSHERDPPPIGNVNKTRPGPARRIHANPP